MTSRHNDQILLVKRHITKAHLAYVRAIDMVDNEIRQRFRNVVESLEKLWEPM